MDVPRRFRGRIWIDPETDAVRRIDETLMGPTDVPLPMEVQRRRGFGGGLYITLSRSSSSVRYEAVTFADPQETLMLPTSIENVWITIAGGARGVRMTQEFRNYRRFLTESRIVAKPGTLHLRPRAPRSGASADCRGASRPRCARGRDPRSAPAPRAPAT